MVMCGLLLGELCATYYQNMTYCHQMKILKHSFKNMSTTRTVGRESLNIYHLLLLIHPLPPPPTLVTRTLRYFLSMHSINTHYTPPSSYPLINLNIKGMIEVRSFLVYILAAGNPTLNPFLPKDPVEYAAQVNLSKVLSNMTGKMRREVHGLNGPAMTRFVVDESHGTGTAAEEAKELLELATSKNNKTAMQLPGQEVIATTKVGFSPQPPSTSRPSPATHIHQQHQYGSSGNSHSGADSGSAQRPRRPISAPPSMQTTLFGSGEGSNERQSHVNHHRSPRAMGHPLHVYEVPIPSSSSSSHEGPKQGNNELMGECDFDGSNDERDLQAMKDELTRLSAWEDYEQQQRSGDQNRHHQQQLNDHREHDRIDWNSFPVPAQDINTGRSKKGGGRPYTPAANAVCAARRVPHFKNWKKTDPYQGTFVSHSVAIYSTLPLMNLRNHLMILQLFLLFHVVCRSFSHAFKNYCRNGTRSARNILHRVETSTDFLAKVHCHFCMHISYLISRFLLSHFFRYIFLYLFIFNIAWKRLDQVGEKRTKTQR